MTSIVPGYEYDIFISYRQKDNKGDKWVTRFVESLKTELDAAFKEEISIYFDENQEDRLQETHVVNKSLEGKLRCLIFIPVLSRTYCDPNSYAWQNEFLTFNKLAAEDSFGRDVRLRKGNYASRILPILIHELEPEDVKLFEKETGNVLRAMDFVFRTASGVNRPLKSAEDHPLDNLNKTFYSDQINRVANAIKEIIEALKSDPESNIKVDSRIPSGAIPAKKSTEGTDSNRIRHRSLTKWLIMSFVLILCIGAFVIYNALNHGKQSQNLSGSDKSIAVLPFVNDSPDQQNMYFINGIMEEILNNLQKIKDFRVLSRTSTQQYRGINKSTITKIAKELDVNYIVEGSGQKYGNKFVLRVQLIAANNEKHLWGESFSQEIVETSDIINLQSQIAQKIAAELEATITPEEKQLIEKTATTNLTAYDFYQRGREEFNNYWWGNNNNQALRRAEELYKQALQYDSTFALAYSGLAGVYYVKHSNEYGSYFTNNYLDSLLILTNRALSFDDHLSEGYFYRGWYYLANGNTESAIKEFDKAIKFNPNDWQTYAFKGLGVYLQDLNKSDYVKGLEYLYKAARINHGTRELTYIYSSLGFSYAYCAGFPDEAELCFKEAFKLDGDTISYLSSIGSLEIQYGNFEKGIEKSLKAYTKDSVEWRLAKQYSFHGLNKEALKYFNRYIERMKSLGQIPQGTQQMIGYLYWQNGDKKEAEHWFDEQKKLSLESIKLGRQYATSVFYSSNAYFDLASVYAFTGEKEKAYEILKTISRYPIINVSMVEDMKIYNPLLNSLRNEPEFQQILKVMETKYQAEHERVRKWLEEQGKL